MCNLLFIYTMPPPFKDREVYFHAFKAGRECGLEYFYQTHFSTLYFYGLRYIHDGFALESILQEAFLTLWHSRDGILSTGHLSNFLRCLVRRQCFAWQRKSMHRFHQSMLPLEDFHESMVIMDDVDKERDEEKTLRILQVTGLLKAQRKDILMRCLEYNFQYACIARLTGMPVGYLQRESKKAIEDIKKMLRIPGQKKKVIRPTQVRLSEGQLKILQLRFEAQCSFEEIAAIFDSDVKTIQQEFLKAYRLREKPNQAMTG
jgi:RNA polymerase sigma factor (sigma-70 family)